MGERGRREGARVHSLLKLKYTKVHPMIALTKCWCCISRLTERIAVSMLGLDNKWKCCVSKREPLMHFLTFFLCFFVCFVFWLVSSVFADADILASSLQQIDALHMCHGKTCLLQQNWIKNWNVYNPFFFFSLFFVHQVFQEADNCNGILQNWLQC